MKRIFLISIMLVCFLTPLVANAVDYGWKDPKTETLLNAQNFVYAGAGMGVAVGSFYFLNRTVGLPYKLSEIIAVVAVSGGTYVFEDKFSRYNPTQGGASWTKSAFAVAGSTVGVLLFAYDKKTTKVSFIPTGNGLMVSVKF